MAQATHTPAVTRTEVVEIKPEGIALQLSMEEAVTLQTLLSAVSGSCTTSHRKYTEAIYAALSNVGVKYKISIYETLSERPHFKEGTL